MGWTTPSGLGAHSDLGACRRMMRGGCWGWEGWGVDSLGVGSSKQLGFVMPPLLSKTITHTNDIKPPIDPWLFSLPL